MAFEMKMPDLATTGSDVRVIRWLVEIGKPVQRGDLLLEVETDKAAMEVESVVTGTLREIRVDAGEEIAAGQVIAVIDDGSGSTVPMQASEIRNRVDEPGAPSPVAASGATGKTGMFARNRAARIQDDALDTQALSANQRVVARRMLESKQTVPHFYLEASFNAEAIVVRRTRAGAKLAWDAFFVYAAASAMQRFPKMRNRLRDDRLVPFEGNAIGVAVDSAGELFVLPVQTDGEPEDIARRIVGGVDAIRAGNAKSLEPAAMTITNLGATKVERFYAIVNPPEAAILAVGRIAAAVVARDGAVVVEHRGVLTLSVDHRIVSGKYAADFLSAIVEELEKL